MTIREELEEREREYLSPYAALSKDSKGREREEAPCDIRSCFQRDRDRILHCKSFRRLKQKTQVFLAPSGDHYRTRLTHTLEVSQIARTIAKSLHLNEDLVEAIALGHDLGHTPYGHAGERALNQLQKNGFRHNEQSIREVCFLEKEGRGLNLTWEVRDGILNHKTKSKPFTLEGQVVRLSDKIAYLNHDTDDAIRAGILKEFDFPATYRDVLGENMKQRLNTLVHDVIMNSMDKAQIEMSEPVAEAMQGLRSYMFSHVYTHPIAKGEEVKVENMITNLYHYYVSHPELLPELYLRVTKERDEPVERAVCDYIAGMTDNYAVMKFQEYFVPESWKK